MTTFSNLPNLCNLFYEKRRKHGSAIPSTWTKLTILIFFFLLWFLYSGSVIGSHFHRQALAALNYIADSVALISGFAIVRPLDETVIGVALGIIFGGFLFYICITWIGGRWLEEIVERQEKNSTEKGEEPINLSVMWTIYNPLNTERL